MSRRDDYPAGVPCFVDTLTADVEAAKGFYGAIFGWEFAGPGRMPGDPPGEYFVARVDGDDVAGVGTASSAERRRRAAPAWNTHVAVDSADEAATRARGGRRSRAGGAVRRAPGRADGGDRRSGRRAPSPCGRPATAPARPASTSRRRGR